MKKLTKKQLEEWNKAIKDMKELEVKPKMVKPKRVKATQVGVARRKRCKICQTLYSGKLCPTCNMDSNEPIFTKRRIYHLTKQKESITQALKVEKSQLLRYNRGK